MAHSTSIAGLLVRVVVAFALTYVLGYERELRGSPGFGEKAGFAASIAAIALTGLVLYVIYTISVSVGHGLFSRNSIQIANSATCR